MTSRWGLVLVLTVATAIRIASHLELRDGPLLHFHRWSETDMAFYHRWARTIAAGDVLTTARMRPEHSWHAKVAREAHELVSPDVPFDAATGVRLWDRWLGSHTFYQDPLYPYVVAGVYAMAGERPGAVRLLQGLLGILGVALVWLLSRRLFGELAALAAGLLAAGYGPSVFHESLLLRESLESTVVLATLVALTAAVARPGRGRLLLAGALLGTAILVRSSLALFAALALPILFHRLWPARRGALAFVILGAGLVLAPLVARNVAVGAPPFAIAASGPLAFIAGNAADGDPATFGAVSRHTAAILARTDGRWLPVIRETLRTHPSPAAWLRHVGGKVRALWHWYAIPDNADYQHWRLHAPRTARLVVEYWMVAPLALVGLFIGCRRTHVHLVVLAFVAAAVATQALFFSVGRLRVPLALVLMPFAGHALAELVSAARAGRWPRVLALGAGTAALAVTILRPLPPDRLVPRPADVGVANEIVGHLARQADRAGDPARALALVERQLATEPPALGALEPSTGETALPRAAAAVAGSYADLHALAASLAAARGDTTAAAAASRRASVLHAVAAQARAQGLAP